MTLDKPEDFYRTYAAFKSYETPVIKRKHVRWYDREFWLPAACTVDTSVIEIGSGTGEFLAYLERKGCKRFHGVEQDPDAVAAMPAGLAEHVTQGDLWHYLETAAGGAPFERVALLDVLEHFPVPDAAKLLQAIKGVLRPGGMVVVRVPNMGSPWGGIHQFADLTHQSAYTANSLHQLALATGYEPVEFLAQKRGSPMRRLAEDCLHGVLSRVLAVPPAVWTPNIIAIFRFPGGG